MRSNFILRLFIVLMVAIVLITLGIALLDDFPSVKQPSPLVHTRVERKKIPQTLVKPSLLAPLSDFETGVVYPRWDKNGYGPQDKNWQTGLAQIRTEMDAHWIEMPLVFSQSQNNNSVFDQVTPSLATFETGVKNAHAHGYRVFMIPLMTTRTPGGWANLITFDTYTQEATWFSAFEHLYLPYIQVAQKNAVEQLSIGTESGWLQNNGSVTLWTQYIQLVRSAFSGKVAYDTDWGNLGDTPPSWFSLLDYIGVSVYIPLIDSPYRVDPRAMPALWSAKIGTTLDQYAATIHKQLILSEIGYRNSTDPFFEPWRSTSTTPLDETEQAGACSAVLSYVSKDGLIHGTFFWGWDDVGAFTLQHTEAAKAIASWYQKLS